VGRLSEEKGYHLLLEALARLAGEGYRFRLSVVGVGPWRERLEALARGKGLTEQVSFAGRIYHEELPDHYRRADIFVLACVRSATNSEDNLPNVLLEAMACGLPTVTSRQRGIPELIRDGTDGLLVEPGDVAGLAYAIRRLMDDRALAARLGRAGRKRVEEAFDHETSIRRLAAIFRRELAAGRLEAWGEQARPLTTSSQPRRADG
jgi:glycosyltransferase involved in cell wall biosynthesis